MSEMEIKITWDSTLLWCHRCFEYADKHKMESCKKCSEYEDKSLTLADIYEALEEIERVRESDASAHNLEDALYERFVRHVAQYGSPELAEMARAVLKTKDIDFSRWYE